MEKFNNLVVGMGTTALNWVQDNYLSLVFALLIFIVGKWIVKIITKTISTIMTKAHVDGILVDFLSAIIRAALLLFVVIAALSQLGIETTSLVALVGAAGLAVGLALKDSLQNFASGVMLIIFRPFKTGDFIDAAGVMGSVEKIAIFATTLKTPDNKEIIIPNGQVYGGTITNYSARPTRRVDMKFGISYDDDIRLAKQVLADIIKQDDRVLPEPEPVIAVSELGDSSVNFIVRPWVNSEHYWQFYWDMQEKVKLTFDEKGISIPYPQMDVHLDK